MNKYIIKKNKYFEYYFLLMTENKQIISRSYNSYKTIEECENAIEVNKKYSLTNNIEKQ